MGWIARRFRVGVDAGLRNIAERRKVRGSEWLVPKPQPRRQVMSQERLPGGPEDLRFHQTGVGPANFDLGGVDVYIELRGGRIQKQKDDREAVMLHESAKGLADGKGD